MTFTDISHQTYYGSLSKQYIIIKIIQPRTPYHVKTFVKDLSLLNTVSFFNMIMVKYSASDIICALFSPYITVNCLWNWLSDTLWNLSQPARRHQVNVRIKESMISGLTWIGRNFFVKLQSWYNFWVTNYLGNSHLTLNLDWILNQSDLKVETNSNYQINS